MVRVCITITLLLMSISPNIVVGESWKPDQKSVCHGVKFTQNKKHNGYYLTRNSTGTLESEACEKDSHSNMSNDLHKSAMEFKIYKYADALPLIEKLAIIHDLKLDIEKSTKERFGFPDVDTFIIVAVGEKDNIEGFQKDLDYSYQKWVTARARKLSK